MASYLITGVSRGIGFEMLKQLSAIETNTVVGIVRDKDATLKKVANELGQRANVYIYKADLTDYASIRSAVKDVSDATGGSLDFVIANAAFMSFDSAFSNIGELGEDPERFEKDLLHTFQANVIGNIHLLNLFMPLILKGQTKKICALTTGFADDQFSADYDLELNAPYVISKAALNTAIVKFSAQYRRQGVLCMAIAPGAVDTGYFGDLSESQMKRAGEQFASFQKYAPDFTGMATPEQAVMDVLAVFHKATVADSAGAFVSQFGNKQWL